jgi:hypothetical protein
VCKLLEIDKSRTSPYHPQSDGLVERMNRTIEAMISMFVSPGQRDWDEFLPYIMMAYRSAVHSTTGYSPNRMMLGREVELPIDLIIGVPEDAGKLLNSVDYVDKLRLDMEEVHKVARQHIKWRSAVQKRNYDLKAQNKRYEECELVWMHNPAKKIGISPKLSRSWEGPYIVLNRLSDVTYRIKGGLRAKMKIVHFDRLKPYLGEEVPAWIQLEIKKWNKKKVDVEFEKEMAAALLEETVLYDYDEVEIKEEETEEGHDIENNSLEIPNTICENIDRDDNVVRDKKLKEGAEGNEIEHSLRRSKRTIRPPERYRE